MLTKTLACAAMAIGGILSGPATAQNYLCDVNNKGQRGFITPEMAIYGIGTGKVTVLDPLIYHYNDKKPIQARLASSVGDTVTLTWMVTHMTSGGALRVRHKAVLNTKTGKLSREAKLARHNQRSFGRGSCKAL